MGKPSHRVMLTKLFFYLNFLFWHHLGTQLKFQARADAVPPAVPPAANGATTTKEPQFPPNEVSALTKLGPLDISSINCTSPTPTSGISIYCDCSYEQKTVCHIKKIFGAWWSSNSSVTTVIPEEVGALEYLSYL